MENLADRVKSWYERKRDQFAMIKWDIHKSVQEIKFRYYRAIEKIRCGHSETHYPVFDYSKCPLQASRGYTERLKNRLLKNI